MKGEHIIIELARKLGVADSREMRRLAFAVKETVTEAVLRSKTHVYGKYPGNMPGYKAVSAPSVLVEKTWGCYHVEARLASCHAPAGLYVHDKLDARAVTITVLAENRVFLEEHTVEMAEMSFKLNDIL